MPVISGLRSPTWATSTVVVVVVGVDSVVAMGTLR